MRRVAAVTTIAEVESVQALLDTVPEVAAPATTSFDHLAWHELDVLWIHDLRTPLDGLGPWLRAGGRLLATLDAVQIPLALGIDSVPPSERSGSPGEDGATGLAGFGPHPLFADLLQGTDTGIPSHENRARGVWYAEARPADGAVVAVERRGLELFPARIAAWEYRVGNGGILCVGSGIHIDAITQGNGAQLRTLLRNALVGEGIPHRDRRASAPVWPVPGTRTLTRDVEGASSLPGLDGIWAEAAAEEPTEWLATSATHSAMTGRRGTLIREANGRVSEAWLHPFRVMQDASPGRHDQVAHQERWMVALEHPVIYWEAASDDGGPVLVDWTVDLRRAWPYPAACTGDLELSLDGRGRRAVLRAVGDPFRLLVEVEHGALEAVPTVGPAVRFTVRAPGRCRVRLIGASDDADLERSRQMLERRGLAGLQRQRAEHRRELATYLTSIESPEPALAESVEWAKVRMDGALAGVPGVGRCLAFIGRSMPDQPGGAWFSTEAACRTALAQLALGDRTAPRDTLKFLSITQDDDGRLVEECSTAGLARIDTTKIIPFYLLLAAGYAAWTGELDFLGRRWTAIRRALDAAVLDLPWVSGGALAALWAAALEGLPSLAESLGHLEAAEQIAAHAQAARAAAGAATFPVGPAGLRAIAEGGFESGLAEWRTLAAPGSRNDGRSNPAAVAALAIEGLWGVRASALESAVRVAPWFPPGWDGMALERLRVGRTVLSVRMRRRFGQVAAQVERLHGPRIHVEFELRGEAAGPVHLDDVAMPRGRVAFEADSRHALLWHG